MLDDPHTAHSAHTHTYELLALREVCVSLHHLRDYFFFFAECCSSIRHSLRFSPLHICLSVSHKITSFFLGSIFAVSFFLFDTTGFSLLLHAYEKQQILLTSLHFDFSRPRHGHTAHTIQVTIYIKWNQIAHFGTCVLAAAPLLLPLSSVASQVAKVQSGWHHQQLLHVVQIDSRVGCSMKLGAPDDDRRTKRTGEIDLSQRFAHTAGRSGTWLGFRHVAFSRQ